MASGAQDFKLPFSQETVGRRSVGAMRLADVLADRGLPSWSSWSFAAKNGRIATGCADAVVTMAGLAG